MKNWNSVTENEIEIANRNIYIHIDQPDGTHNVAICDAIDFDLVLEYTWRLNKAGYVITKSGILMHRLILGLSHNDSLIGDHKNGNKLLNTRNNLRIVSSRQNSQNRGITRRNTSGVPGVLWVDRKWLAQIKVGTKTIRLGTFFPGQFDLAVECRKQAEIKYFGEYSRAYGHLVNT